MLHCLLESYLHARILTKLRGGYSRTAGGGGEMARFEERGEEVYRM